MSAIVIIPARYSSSRLPGKPLLAETGKPLILHVVDAARRAKRVERVVVATDDSRIVDAVTSAGGEAIMTREDHTCGTDRLAEAAETLSLPEDAIVVNVQGDEPEMPGECIDRLIELLEGSDAEMATLATNLPAGEASDPNNVKVVLDVGGKALYFSRAAIPCDRDGGGAEYLLHLGIYAYRAGFLKRLAATDSTPLEMAEKLEQLRALENGHSIFVAVVDYDGAGIDTPRDYAAFVARVRATHA